ncbi:T-cell immunoglobulin and mucin domain-containing protein 4-like isoform X2 [Hippocampus comes]|uniref:T-cell immunoglobulin and mucin domain-containing protein 4-like isoform X2 n=1 Tax=Hippocampus comes TaxID=109280 RepID=UPI00094E536D|nr:PREDICTED: T-cell immunoglobulin and mucin domain-containing protein 4-like isoform X2 [Hippocampus comes]
MKMRTRFSTVLLCCLLTVCESSPSSVRGIAGQDVTLSCTYDIIKHGSSWVCWVRGALPMIGCGLQIAKTNGVSVTEESDRYKLLGRLEDGNVSLTILNARKEDAGVYGCRVQVPGPFNDEKHSIELIIMDAPQSTTLKTVLSAESIAAVSTAAQMTSSEGFKTSSSSIDFKTKTEKGDIPGSMVAIGVLFGLILFGAVISIIIAGRRRRQRLTKIHQQLPSVPSVYFSSTSSSLHLHHQPTAVDNIYQMDTDEYDYLP